MMWMLLEWIAQIRLSSVRIHRYTVKDQLLLIEEKIGGWRVFMPRVLVCMQSSESSSHITDSRHYEVDFLS